MEPMYHGDRAAQPAPAHSPGPHRRSPTAPRESAMADSVDPSIVDLLE